MTESTGRHYDELVVAYDMFLTSLIKVEVLNSTQFRDFCDRLKVSGFDPEQEQLIYTFLEAMRKD